MSLLTSRFVGRCVPWHLVLFGRICDAEWILVPLVIVHILFTYWSSYFWVHHAR